MFNDNFLGLNGFFWFVGVVESRQDPLKVGRVQVRVVGSHTADLNVLPTTELPWCLVMLPITSSGISGIGQSATGLLEGSWVFGYFRDGERRQEPVVMGSLPGRPAASANPAKGFSDPNGIYPLYINESDVNRLAVNDTEKPHPSLEQRKNLLITGIATADFNTMPLADGGTTAASDGTLWNQPAIPYNARYPYNSVYQSESGHLLEFDDTSILINDEDGSELQAPLSSNIDGYTRVHYERVQLRHNSNTGIEMTANGDLTSNIEQDHYSIIKRNNSSYIGGDSDITINGRHKLFINKDGGTNNHYDIQVGPNANINIHVDKGDLNFHSINGRINMRAGGDFNLAVGGNMNVAVAGAITTTSNSDNTTTIGGQYTMIANGLLEDISGDAKYTYNNDLYTTIGGDTYTDKAGGGTDYTSTAARGSGDI